VSRRARLAVFVVAALGMAALLVWAFAEAPLFGAQAHPYGDRAVQTALSERSTANAIASVTFDQRGLDTMGEEYILFAAVLGACVLLRREPDEYADPGAEEAASDRPSPGPSPEMVRLAGYMVLPFVVVAGIYVIAHGHLTPGGGFQGGIVLATALHLLYIAGDYPTLRRLRPQRVFEIAEASAAAGYVVVGLIGLALTGAFLINLLPYGTLGQLGSAGTVPLLNVAVGLEVGSAMVLLLAEFLDQTLILRPRPEGSRSDGSRSGAHR
jgi:multicomponent Na+:H+ antiporter subunit B